MFSHGDSDNEAMEIVSAASDEGMEAEFEMSDPPSSVRKLNKPPCTGTVVAPLLTSVQEEGSANFLLSSWYQGVGLPNQS